MLNREHLHEPRVADETLMQSMFGSLRPEDIIKVIRRQWPVIAGCVAAALLLAFAYLITAAPKFTATMSIMIDTRKSQLFQNQQVLGDMTIDSSAVESQVEVLKSDTIALAVIRSLKLTDSPEFVGSSEGLVSWLISAVTGGGQPLSDERLEQIAMQTFSRNLQAKRVGLTYAIEVNYTALSADKAARIANAIGDAYMVGELDSKYQATLRASRWLQERMGKLRDEATASDAAVQAFKSENGIVDTNRGSINDQQLVDANTQLTAARATTAEAKAKLDRIQNIAKDGVPDATVTEALRSEVITRLRAQMLDMSAREADLSNRYGASHQAASNLRNQITELRRSIADETRRIAQGLASEYEQAKARESQLKANLDALVARSTVSAQAQIKLRDLESTAQSYRNLYDNFLQRFMEATQQQTFPISEARIISPASPPLKKSAPKTIVVMALALALGLAAGGAGAFAREQMDNVFRDAEQAQQMLGIECLGILPRVESAADIKGLPADPERRLLRTDIGIDRFVVEAPFSRFTETLRNVKVAVDIAKLQREIQVIAVVSALPHEGKTTIAANLAQLMASTQHRTLLIDGDLRNPTLTRTIVPEAKLGLVEVITGKCEERSVIWIDPVTGMHMLPAVVDGRISHTADLMSSINMTNLLARLREHYDYIILDMPPILPVVDVKAASFAMDGFVYVAAWGKTPRNIVKQAITNVEFLQDRAIGTLLNGANPAVLKRIESSDGRYYADYHHGYGYRDNS